MNLAEAEDIKKRWQEYTEELYKNKQTNKQTNKKKNFMTQITTVA